MAWRSDQRIPSLIQQRGQKTNTTGEEKNRSEKQQQQQQQHRKKKNVVVGKWMVLRDIKSISGLEVDHGPPLHVNHDGGANAAVSNSTYKLAIMVQAIGLSLEQCVLDVHGQRDACRPAGCSLDMVLSRHPMITTEEPAMSRSPGFGGETELLQAGRQRGLAGCKRRVLSLEVTN